MTNDRLDFQYLSDAEGGNHYFESKIKLRTYKDGFISLEEESELLDFAAKILSPPLPHSVAHDLILRSAALNHLAVECQIQSRCARLLKQFTRDDGQIDAEEFESVVAVYREASHNRVAEDEIRQKLKAMMVDQGWKAKKDGLFRSHWFDAIPS